MISSVRSYIIILGFLLVLIGVIRLLFPVENQEYRMSEMQVSKDSREGMVEVAGEVVKPGVMSVVLGVTRVKDVIDYAGGITVEADKEYVDMNINMSSMVRDGQKVFVPKKGQSMKTKQLVSINEASLEQLESLPSVGEVTAEKIVNNRPYNKLEDLYVNNVVSRTIYKKIEDLIEI